MNDVIVTRKQKVMQIDPEHHVAWSAVLFEHEEGNTMVEIDSDEWKEMGKPDTITVTIEVGDTLNV